MSCHHLALGSTAAAMFDLLAGSSWAAATWLKAAAVRAVEAVIAELGSLVAAQIAPHY